MANPTDISKKQALEHPEQENKKAVKTNSMKRKPAAKQQINIPGKKKSKT